MEHLTYSSLPSIGVNPLTGESCAYSQRILCDLNEQGVELIADWLGIPTYPKPAFAENWNSSVDGKPAVASVMLARECMQPLMLFALLRQGWAYIVESGSQFTAFNDKDIEREPNLKEYLDPESWLCKMHPGIHVYRNPRPDVNSKIAGSRNVHQFTGRTL